MFNILLRYCEKKGICIQTDTISFGYIISKKIWDRIYRAKVWTSIISQNKKDHIKSIKEAIDLFISKLPINQWNDPQLSMSDTIAKTDKPNTK